jgi:hypothetical protein
MEQRAWIYTAVILVLTISVVGTANAYVRTIYDCSNPKGDALCYSRLEPSNEGYPVQYTPYVFGRREGQPERGPNPVPGATFGSTDVDREYEMISVIHQYYLDKFGRNGPNGQGGLGNSPDPVSTASNSPFNEYRVRVNRNGTNPDFCRSGGANFVRDPVVAVNFCCGLLTHDVLGHELNHALFFHEFNAPLPLFESGAINESFGDFFGESFERYATGSNDWKNAFRSLSDPSSKTYNDGVIKPYPDRYLSPNFSTTSSDQGGVHRNSTIVSHAAFLAAEGGQFNGFGVVGIGLDKVEQIWYRVETEYFDGSENFNAAYVDIIQAATDLYGPEDVWEVTKALRAVELNMSRSFNGDFNADGQIDAADYTVWRDGLGSMWSAAMYDIWKSNFGSIPGHGSLGTSIAPEPSSSLLCLIGCSILATRRRSIRMD